MNFKVFKSLLIRMAVIGSCCGPSAWLVYAQTTSHVPPLTFDSPAQATEALVKAATAQDHQAIRELFGPQITNLLTGDKVLDEEHFKAFAKDLSERCETVQQGADKITLEIGSASWPFPIPLVRTNGAWRFDTSAGEEEIINRHIGRNEYHAIGVCRAYVKAQREYAQRFSHGKPQYAMRLRNHAGKTDGLYWPLKPGSPPSPLSQFVADACLEKYNWSEGKGPRSFHGYLFKILTQQGDAAPGGKMNYVRDGKMTDGFALVAYPVRWGESGVMTFIVGQRHGSDRRLVLCASWIVAVVGNLES